MNGAGEFTFDGKAWVSSDELVSVYVGQAG
jgi:hypothetical protein